MRLRNKTAVGPVFSVLLVTAVFATNIATADQYLAVVLPGRMFKHSFKERGLPPVLLSRSVGASATPSSALVPWNSCGAYMAAALGVPTLSYAGFAFFSLLNPLATIAIAFLGFRMLRAEPPVDSGQTSSD